MKLAFLENNHMYIRVLPGEENTTRILACPTQLPLMDKLKGSYVEVCSMNQLDGRKKLTPDYVLDRLQEVTESSEYGGFRSLETAEYVSLLFATCVNWAEPEMSEMITDPEVLTLLLFHPLFCSGVTFASYGFIQAGLCGLAVEIYDIRRFIDPSNIRKSGRLRSYFHLAGPKNIIKILESKVLNNNLDRSVWALMAWFNPRLLSCPRELVYGTPNFFLYRDYYDYFDKLSKTSDSKTAHGIALWKCTLRHLNFVYQLWLGAVLESYTFDPERFFYTTSEIASFNTYIKRFDKSFDNSISIL